jgi:hypothetical protein
MALALGVGHKTNLSVAVFGEKWSSVGVPLGWKATKTDSDTSSFSTEERSVRGRLRPGIRTSHSSKSEARGDVRTLSCLAPEVIRGEP